MDNKILGGTGLLSYSAASFLSLFIEAVCYGLFITTYITSTFILCRKRSARTSKLKVNIPLTTISTLMFIFATMHFLINAWRGYQAFVATNEEPQAWLIARGTKSVDFLLKNLLLDLQVFLGDGFLIWRLYIAYSRNKLIVAPFLFLGVVMVAMGITVNVLHTIRDPTDSLFENPYVPIGVLFFTSTMVLNLGCSSLIAFRIYRAQQSHYAFRRLSQVAALILESASIYAAMMVLIFVLYLTSSGGMKLALDAAMHIIGISFCGIIASLQLGFSVPSVTAPPSHHHHHCTCPELSTCTATTCDRCTSSLSTRMADDDGIKLDTLPGETSFVSTVSAQDKERPGTMLSQI